MIDGLQNGQKQDSVFILLDLLNAQMDLFKTAIDSNYNTTAIKNQIEVLQNNITAIIQFSDNIYDNLSSNKKLQADVINADVVVLQTTTTIERNEKTVNQIYLETIAKEIYHFTQSQINALTVVARQCPVEGGNAVFKARALLALINNTLNYDDRDICNRVGIELKQGQPDLNGGNIKLYPNPANSKVKVVYLANEDFSYSFTIYNSIGQIILIKKLNSDSSYFEFDSSAINQGVYYYCYIGTDGLNENGKLIIIH